MSKKAKGYWSNRFTSREVYLWTCNKWSTINQRTVNGKYVNQPACSLNAQHRSYLAKGIMIDMTQEEFYDWCSSNENKILQMMKAGERPSIDRICDECSYSIDNIHIIPLISNMRKDSTSTKTSFRDKTQYTLKNRQVYITNHEGYAYKELIIDYYLKNYPVKFVLECVNLNLIEKYLELVTPETVINSDVVKILEDKVAEAKKLEELAIKAIEDRKSRVIARKSRKEAILNRKSDKKWAKSLLEYDEVTKEVNKIRQLLVLKGTTVQKEVIRILKEKYNRN